MASEGVTHPPAKRYQNSWGFEVDAQLIKQEKRTGDVATISTKGTHNHNRKGQELG